MFKRIYYWWMENVLDKHVCKEFTQWKEEIRKYKEYPSYNEHVIGIQERMVTKRFQSRQCTMCGKTYQEELEL